jgi:predicted transglutaminase-like cysteine proteinase
MEEKRLQVTEEEMAMYFERLDETIDGVQAHFNDHIDEMGHQEWVGCQENVWYVSSAHGESHVYFPVP